MRKTRGGLFPSALTCAFVLVACAATHSDIRTVHFLAPRACPVPSAAVAILHGYGDFDRPEVDPGNGFSVATRGTDLSTLGSDTKEILAHVASGDDSWLGRSPIADDASDVPLFLWKVRATCALSTALDPRDEGGIARVGSTDVLISGGRSEAIPRSYLVDLLTGSVKPVDPDLLVPRVGASVTGGSSFAVVAGGSDPLSGSLVEDAEILVLSVRGFDRQSVRLSTGRKSHGAALLATREVVLVGGEGPSGLLRSLEIVDPVSFRARTAGLALLEAPRKSPTVLRLANGELLVLGGRDSSGAVLSRVEWFTPDASRAVRPSLGLPLTENFSAISLPGGGALVVVAPDSVNPGLSAVWILGEDGALAAADAAIGVLTLPRLFDGAGGEPILWTGDRWLQWTAWDARFVPLLTGTSGPDGPLSLSFEPGLPLWISENHVLGLSFTRTSSYASLPESLLVNSLAGLVPDRLPSDASYSFSSSQGLSLAAGVQVTLADRTFANFALDFEFGSGAPPLVLLRGEEGTDTTVGGADCPFPPGPAVHLERVGDRVLGCKGRFDAQARLRILFRGGPVGSKVRAVRVQRRG